MSSGDRPKLISARNTPFSPIDGACCKCEIYFEEDGECQYIVGVIGSDVFIT